MIAPHISQDVKLYSAFVLSNVKWFKKPQVNFKELTYLNYEYMN